MKIIKNIIFDLGGVLLDIDYQNTIDRFKQLGIKNFEDMFSQLNADDLFENLETGKLSEPDFYKTLKEKIPFKIEDIEITNAWNDMILHFRLQSLNTLEKLSSKYKLYLLSNTNSIHLKYFQDLFTKETGMPLLDNYFIKAWYSHQIGLRKPGTKIFEYVLGQEGLQAVETLFIDDTASNIKMAKNLGFQTHLLLPGETIESLGL